MQLIGEMNYTAGNATKAATTAGFYAC